MPSALAQHAADQAPPELEADAPPPDYVPSDEGEKEDPAPTLAEADVVACQGVVQAVMHWNSTNNFAILRIRDDEGEQVVMGPTLNGVTLRVGDRVMADGFLEDHHVHGKRLRCPMITPQPRASTDGVLRWLRRGGVPGVGLGTAKELQAAFGDQLVDAVTDEARLSTIIPANRAKAIVEAWRQVQDNTVMRTVLWLMELGFREKTATRLINMNGADRLRARLTSDPWLLVFDEDGISFTQAETVARALDIPPTANRLPAAAVEILTRAARSDGHVGLPPAVLAKRLTRFTGESVDAMKKALSGLIASGHVRYGKAGKTALVYLPDLWHAERDLIAKITEALAEPPRYNDEEIDEAITAALQEINHERVKPIVLEPEQVEAVRLSLKYPLCVITGGAGTGKTTIQQVIVLALRLLASIRQEFQPKVAGISPTGMAAKRLTDSMAAVDAPPAQTTHAFLRCTDEGFFYNSRNPVPVHRLLDDEVSMNDLELFADLFRAIDFTSTSIALIGDEHQLPSVGPGRVLADLIASGVIPYVRLVKPHRSSEESGIVPAANMIKDGKMPPVKLGTGWRMKLVENAEEAHAYAQQLVARNFGFDPLTQIQVLAPGYAGAAGIDALNTSLREMLNPELGVEEGIDGFPFRVGDKVVQLVNDKERRVVNGDIGLVQEILYRQIEDALGGTVLQPNGLVVQFDERRVRYERSQLDQLRMSYCISVHKAQGGEREFVIIVLTDDHKPLLNRNLFYTGATRGKKVVFVVGTKTAIQRAVATVDGSTRYSILAPMLREAVEAMRPTPAAEPIEPEPRRSESTESLEAEIDAEEATVSNAPSV